MKMKTRFFFTLTLLIVLNISTLPCFAQYAARTQLKVDTEWLERCRETDPSGCPDRVSLWNAVFSPDLQLIAGIYGGTGLYFWDVSTGEIIHKSGACSGTSHPELAFSPNGRTFARVSNEAFACVWNVSADLTVHEHELEEHGRNQVNSIAFSPDGRTLANGVQQNPEGSGFVRLWDVNTGKTLRTLEHPSNVIQVAFSPDGRTLASWGGDGIVRLWDVSAGETVRTLEGVWGVNTLVFSPDCRTLAIGSSALRLWDVNTDETVRRLNAENVGLIYGIAFSSDGGMLASAESHKIIHVWDVWTGEILHTLEGHTDEILSVAFSRSGGTLASMGRPDIVLQWDIASSSLQPPYLAADVNCDGTVDIQDLVAVAAAFGETRALLSDLSGGGLGCPPCLGDEDVNGDGQVNIQDLVAVAAAFGETAANAPAAVHLSQFSPETVAQWLWQAQHLNLTDATSQRGIHFLEQLLLSLTPKETALLANYPNPFNPETWIPYQVAEPTDVTLHIYAVDGTLVRTLSLGHKAVGTYQSRSHAAYWDGKNEFGEPVASGVYFYTLTAGDFTATRKMLIRK